MSVTIPENESDLRKDIKELIVESLRLDHVKPEEIGDGELLFARDNRLGLDSLAALELLTALEYRYGIRFGNDGSAREHFKSVETLASYVKVAPKA